MVSSTTVIVLLSIALLIVTVLYLITKSNQAIPRHKTIDISKKVIENGGNSNIDYTIVIYLNGHVTLEKKFADVGESGY